MAGLEDVGSRAGRWALRTGRRRIAWFSRSQAAHRLTALFVTRVIVGLSAAGALTFSIVFWWIMLPTLAALVLLLVVHLIRGGKRRSIASLLLP